MEEMGMSDFQFKAFLKQLTKRLEEAQSEDEAEAIKKKLADIIQDLKGDIES